LEAKGSKHEEIRDHIAIHLARWFRYIKRQTIV
jgi:hypothetical protein